MQNGAHQQHSQTLQSVAVVSVLEQEQEKRQRQENWSSDCRRDLHREACETLYWLTIVSCESKNFITVMLLLCFLSVEKLCPPPPLPVCLGLLPKITLFGKALNLPQ